MIRVRGAIAGYAAAALAVGAAIAVSIALFDRPLALWAASLDPGIHAALAQLTRLGNSAWYLVPLGIATPALYLWSGQARDPDQAARRRNLMWAAAFVFAAIAASGLLADLLKILFGRARPELLLRDHYWGWQPFSLKSKFHSFPSGHADTVFALAAALGCLDRRLRAPLLLFAAAVAFSRVAIDAHFLSDVIAGGSLGLATTLWLYRALMQRGHRLRPGPPDAGTDRN